MLSYESYEEAVDDQFKKVIYKGSEQLHAITRFRIEEQSRSSLDVLNREGLEFCTLNCEEYPHSLLSIDDKPVILFSKGNNSLLNDHTIKHIGAVGSRTMIPQTQTIIEQSIRQLQDYPVSVVSGLAVGVDEWVHKTALQSSIACVGVLGTSLFEEDFYPKATLHTFHEIIESGGVVVTEYKRGTPRARFNFVRRNRLITGLSDVVTIWQAAIGSGSCTTAQLAQKQNKKVLAVGGMPFDERFSGSQALIKEGAGHLFDGQDILNELGLTIEVVPAQDEVRDEIALRISHHSQPVLSNQAESVYKCLTTNPLSVDEISLKSAIPAHELAAQLTMLELKGLAYSVGSNLWIST